MAVQTVFRRYELKYMITAQQKETLLAAMAPHMTPDRYGRSTIQNIYYDTDTYLLIRRSIEKPLYKEKLRLRCYGAAAPGSRVFVELKKKYRSVVYKRRLPLTEAEAVEWIGGTGGERPHSQIADEVAFFLERYAPLSPAVALSYRREAYYANDGTGFRVTFDDTILCREEDLTLEAGAYGTPLLPEGMVLMELKCPGAIPLWMVQTLSREHIYKTSFSKYGAAYRTVIYPRLCREAARRDGVPHPAPLSGQAVAASYINETEAV